MSVFGVVAVWALALAGSASADICPPGNPDPNYCTRIPTTVVASPVLLGGINARLTRSDTGAPLAGQTINFTVNGSVFCTATTDVNGVAGCTNLISVLTALLNLGYTASYAGNATFAPSSGHGDAINLLGLIVLGPGHAADHPGTASGAHGNARMKARLNAIGRKRLLAELRSLRAHADVHGRQVVQIRAFG